MSSFSRYRNIKFSKIILVHNRLTLSAPGSPAEYMNFAPERGHEKTAFSLNMR